VHERTKARDTQRLVPQTHKRIRERDGKERGRREEYPCTAVSDIDGAVCMKTRGNTEGDRKRPRNTDTVVGDNRCQLNSDTVTYHVMLGV